METKDLLKWNFEKELKIMAESCIGVKPDTAKKKASNLFKKYDDIIHIRLSTKEYYEKQYYLTKQKFDTLKSGVIEYQGFGKTGKIFLKDIEQIEKREKDILLIMKTGREITLGKSFDYLLDLF